MRTNKTLVGLAIAGLIAGGAYKAGAADIGVAGTKLIVVDKVAAAGKAKAVFVAKDPAVDKGTGTDPTTIGAQLQMSYDNGTDPVINGSFDAGYGLSNWLVNKSTVAKYVNKDAPGSPGGTKVSVIKQNNLVKLVGKNTGDVPLDILSQSHEATGTAKTAYCVANGSDSNCFCTEFAGCAWKSIAGDTGAKLVCKGGTADLGCGGVSTHCVGGVPNDVLEPLEQCDDGNANDGDGCTKTCTSCGSSDGTGAVEAPLECQTTKTCKLGSNNGNPCSSDDDCPSGSCTTNNIPGCDANCTTPRCGNGNVSGAETCDDGNTSNFDNCPSDCIIDSCSNPATSCDPGTGTNCYNVQVNFAGSDNVAGLTVFLDYPEGSVIIPGSGGDSAVSDSITDLAGFAFGQANDLDHALIEALADTGPFPQGQAFIVHFQSCDGATPAAGEFSCTVLSAGDENLVPIPGVTCSVAIL